MAASAAAVAAEYDYLSPSTSTSQALYIINQLVHNNNDLVERNATLERDKKRLDVALTDKDQQLRQRLIELQEKDAALAKMKQLLTQANATITATVEDYRVLQEQVTTLTAKLKEQSLENTHLKALLSPQKRSKAIGAANQLLLASQQSALALTQPAQGSSTSSSSSSMAASSATQQLQLHHQQVSSAAPLAPPVLGSSVSTADLIARLHASTSLQQLSSSARTPHRPDAASVVAATPSEAAPRAPSPTWSAVFGHNSPRSSSSSPSPSPGSFLAHSISSSGVHGAGAASSSSGYYHGPGAASTASRGPAYLPSPSLQESISSPPPYTRDTAAGLRAVASTTNQSTSATTAAAWSKPTVTLRQDVEARLQEYARRHPTSNTASALAAQQQQQHQQHQQQPQLQPHQQQQPYHQQYSPQPPTLMAAASPTTAFPR